MLVSTAKYREMIHDLSSKPSILHHYVAELRDVSVQLDRMRFRHNLKRIGTAIGYEISKHLVYDTVDVTTPLGVAETIQISDDIVLVTILRAGLPLHEGLLACFDKADCGYVAAYRNHHKDGTFDIKLEYITCPDLTGKTLIISDPMVATGASVEAALEAIAPYGDPAKVHLVTAIASTQGVEYVQRLRYDVEVWAAAIDQELTAKSYIVPGLGDAGDLAFGSKIQD